MSEYMPIPKKTDEIKSEIARYCFNSQDINFRELTLSGGKHALLVYTEGLCNTSDISHYIIIPLLKNNITCYEPRRLAQSVISAAFYKEISNLPAVIDDFLSGGVALFIDGFDYALCFDLRNIKTRSISEPATEVVVRGPREGFVESYKANMAMLRRKLAQHELTFEIMDIGTRTNTKICLAYINNIAKPGVLTELKKRLNGIDIDSILESGYIEQFIEDAPFSMFPTVGNSEKPDKIAAKILEGRVAVIVDGTPTVLTVPNLFVENFQSAEDYYSRPYFASIIRILRYFAFAISIYLPASYVAMVNFHQELIPFNILVNAAMSDNNVPFGSVFSLLAMGLIYEMLREGGLRLPRPAGNAIGIVGALVIGDAAVSAGLVSEIVLIVVAFTAISSFLVNSLYGAATMLRFLLLIIASIAGFFGIIIATGLLLVHLLSLRSFGVPYLSPFAPYKKGQLRDTFVRFPWWMLGQRPDQLSVNSKRQGYKQKPMPPIKGEPNQ